MIIDTQLDYGDESKIWFGNEENCSRKLIKLLKWLMTAKSARNINLDDITIKLFDVSSDNEIERNSPRTSVNEMTYGILGMNGQSKRN
jgi:hypothetical protein